VVGSTEVVARIEASAARGLSKFVGREREITVLRESLEKAQSGFGQVVGIVGEAGVGKSRLLLETEARTPPGRICFSGREMSPLW